MPFPPLKVLCREWIVEGRRRVWTVAKERSEVWHSEKERQGDSVANLFEKRLIVSFSDSGRLDRDRDPYWQEATRWAHRRRCHWETFLCQPEVRVELLSSKVFGGTQKEIGNRLNHRRPNRVGRESWRQTIQPPTYHTARVYVVQIVSQRKSTQSVRRLSWLLLIIIIILAIIIVREFLVLRFVTILNN